MPISKIDLNSTSKEQLKSLIDENSDQQVECPIEKRHVVKIEHIEAHVSDCLRGNIHLGYKQCSNCTWHIFRSASELEQHRQTCRSVEKSVDTRQDAINQLFGQIF